MSAPVCTAQPSGARTSHAASDSTRTTLRSLTTVAVAKLDWPKKVAVQGELLVLLPAHRAAAVLTPATEVELHPRLALHRTPVVAGRAVPARCVAEDDPIADLDAAHRRADRLDHASALMAEHTRQREGRAPGTDGHVRVRHADRHDLDSNLVASRLVEFDPAHPEVAVNGLNDGSRDHQVDRGTSSPNIRWRRPGGTDGRASRGASLEAWRPCNTYLFLPRVLPGDP